MIKVNDKLAILAVRHNTPQARQDVANLLSNIS